jgi:transposase
LGGTQAALALRALLGGQVKVGVLERPGRARHTPTLTFTMGAAAASAHLSGLPAPAIAPDGGDAIQLVLTKPVESEELADEVKALWDEGWLLREIGERLGKPRGLVETALKTWHRVRGLPEPDARARVKRPAQVPGASPLVIRITDAAKALYDQGLAYQEIAKRLEVGRDAITAAIKYWHVLHEVPVPDGRTRRHQDARLDPGTDPITNTTQLVEAAKALSDEGLEYKEIARRLAVSGATITDAIKRWHVQRDLPVPDGRARRHQLKRSGLATGSDPSSPPFAA